MVLRVESSGIPEPVLCYGEVLAVLSARPVDLHLVRVVRLHTRMGLRDMASQRDGSLKSERAVAAFESQRSSLFLDGFCSLLLLSLCNGLLGSGTGLSDCCVAIRSLP